MRVEPVPRVMWIVLVMFLALTALSGCSSWPEEDVRTVCEWVIMDSRIFEEHAGVDRAIERLTGVAERQMSPFAMLTSMKSSLSELLQEYESLEAAIVSMRADFESPTVLAGLTEVQEELQAVQNSLGECIEIIESAGGDPDRFLSRETEFTAALDRMLRAADAIENTEAAGQMLESASRVLRGMG